MIWALKGVAVMSEEMNRMVEGESIWMLDSMMFRWGLGLCYR